MASTYEQEIAENRARIAQSDAEWKDWQKQTQNQGFFVPSGQSPAPAPVAMGIQNQMGGGYEQRSPWGGYASNYNFPGGQGGQMDPRYFQSLYAPQQLYAQQQQYGQANIAAAIASAKGTLGGMGIPMEGGLGEMEKWTEQRTALESQPIRKATGEAMRTIEDQWARKGSALGSEHERNVAEVQGASLAAMRSSAIGAAIDVFMKRPQLLAQLIQSMRQ